MCDFCSKAVYPTDGGIPLTLYHTTTLSAPINQISFSGMYVCECLYVHVCVYVCVVCVYVCVCCVCTHAHAYVCVCVQRFLVNMANILLPQGMGRT